MRITDNNILYNNFWVITRRHSLAGNQRIGTNICPFFRVITLKKGQILVPKRTLNCLANARHCHHIPTLSLLLQIVGNQKT